eukprot:5966775-Heterocapsa_arctica.AAC.1
MLSAAATSIGISADMISAPVGVSPVLPPSAIILCRFKLCSSARSTPRALWASMRSADCRTRSAPRDVASKAASMRVLHAVV